MPQCIHIFQEKILENAGKRGGGGLVQNPPPPLPLLSPDPPNTDIRALTALRLLCYQGTAKDPQNFVLGEPEEICSTMRLRGKSAVR